MTKQGGGRLRMGIMSGPVLETIRITLDGRILCALRWTDLRRDNRNSDILQFTTL